MNEQRYQILFADDEYWTREKMRRMIPWEEYGLEFLEPAVDGEDVLRKLEEAAPDILITDINMPFLNGVDLLTMVREKYPDIVTFVISGYDDFEYVKGTFMAGTINYLKKPVSKMELVNALTRAMEIIGEREQKKEQLLKAASLIQDREFSTMIQRDQLPFASAMAVSSRESFAGMSLVLIKIHNMQELLQQKHQEPNVFSYHVKKQLKNLLGEDGAIVFNNSYRSNEFIIVTEKMEKELLRTAEKIISSFQHDQAGSCVTVCISGRSYTMESIHMAYVEAVGLLMTRKFCRKDEIIRAEHADKEHTAVRQRMSSECAKQLRNLLLAGNQTGVNQMIFETIGLAGCEKKGWTYLEVRQTLRQVLNILIDHALEEQKHPGAADFENIIETVDKKAEDLQIGPLCSLVREVVLYLMPEKEVAATDSMRDIVQKAVSWVDAHYAEEVTLACLAERYHVEHSYFSRIFRQETGENLIFYVTKKRIEKAKEYIKNTDMNLMEAAFMVGYDDYTYFSRVFKKNTGMSPREYRGSSKGERK